MEFAPLYVIFVLLWAAALAEAYGYGRLGRLVGRRSQEPLQTDVPSCSIVMACHNHAAQLRQNLPALLEQAYPGEFEVIVVDMLSTDGTKDLLESMETVYPHLQHTHCPSTARDISLQRLALTLGVRAASHEWVVFLQPDCRVGGGQWLTELMQPCTDERDAVLGLMVYDEDGTWAGRRRQFFHLWQQTLWLPHALSHAPYRADEACLCYRRSHFMAHQGFAQSALLESGAETLLVNRHVARRRCGVSLRSGAIVRQQMPPRHRWHQDRLFFMATRALMRQGLPYRLRYAWRVAVESLFPLSAVALIAVCWPNPYVAVPVALMWTGVAVVRHLMLRQTTRRLGISSFGLSLPLLLHGPLVWDCTAWLRWLKTDKNTFRKKFV